MTKPKKGDILQIMIKNKKPSEMKADTFAPEPLNALMNKHSAAVGAKNYPYPPPPRAIRQ
jgi:hypothetical protein